MVFLVIFNPNPFGFIVACLFSFERLSSGFLIQLGLSHEAPSFIFMVVECLASPRSHPAFSSLG